MLEIRERFLKLILFLGLSGLRVSKVLKYFSFIFLIKTLSRLAFVCEMMEFSKK